MSDQEIVVRFKGDRRLAECLKKSQDRIARSLEELLSGYSLTAEDVLNEVAKVDDYRGVITVSDINFYSFCEHHFVPFFGKASVAYEPGPIITGIGKIVRLVREVHARRLQIQELMTKDIADDIMRVLKAKGAYVETKAKHLCVCGRGPTDDTAETLVQYGCGSLQKN